MDEHYLKHIYELERRFELQHISQKRRPKLAKLLKQADAWLLKGRKMDFRSDKGDVLWLLVKDYDGIRIINDEYDGLHEQYHDISFFSQDYDALKHIILMLNMDEFSQILAPKPMKHPGGRPKRIVTDAEMERIKQLHEQGWGLNRIASELKMGSRMVKKVLTMN